MKVALITGVTGQDGSYLAEMLLEQGYEVHGLIRRSSSFNRARIEHIHSYSDEIHGGRFHLHYGDVTDTSNIFSVIAKTRPDEIYHLAAQSHVKVSFEVPEYTANADAVGTLRILEAIRGLDLVDSCRFYQASTSELFGLVQRVPQDETVPFYPRSPYGVAKLYAYWITKNYREAYGMYACNGILFNHESPRRGETFVTRKITLSIAEMLAGRQDCIYLGNLRARRDWGHARDFVRAMWLMLQQDAPDDFVIATGVSHTVKEFVEAAFGSVGVELKWTGEGVDEQAIVSGVSSSFGDRLTVGSTVIRIDSRYFRPTEVEELLGDATKAHEVLGWECETSFDTLVAEMMKNDLSLAGVETS